MEYRKILTELLKSSSSPAEFQWINEKTTISIRGKKLGFVMTPRFIADKPVGEKQIHLKDCPYSINLSQWSMDQLARAALLLSMDEGDPEEFHHTIESLFHTAENREAEAIYKTIPIFNYPELWHYRATEAIRSNVGLLFDAMAFNNPYPALHFDDIAWNQMILKTIFSDKSIWKITGLTERRNEPLARAISDFAHERWAANRTLPAEVWYLTEPYPGDRFWTDADTLLNSEDESNQQAGFLLWKTHQNSAPQGFAKKHQVALDLSESLSPQWRELQSAVQDPFEKK